MAAISLRDGWRAKVIVDRDDSIILTLPSGDRQLQHFDRRAGFTLAMDGDGRVSIRLDSLTYRPQSLADPAAPVGAIWDGVVDSPAIDALHVSGGSGAAELTGFVRALLPRLPVGGVRAHATWTDSAAGNVRVDIFNASERRTAAWSAGALRVQDGSVVLPVRMREDFEQLGDGAQSGRKMTMTSQGRRSGTYYVTEDGRINAAQLSDSVAMLISIPASKQVVPTIRYARTSVRFIPVGGSESEDQ